MASVPPAASAPIPAPQGAAEPWYSPNKFMDIKVCSLWKSCFSLQRAQFVRLLRLSLVLAFQPVLCFSAGSRETRVRVSKNHVSTSIALHASNATHLSTCKDYHGNSWSCYWQAPPSTPSLCHLDFIFRTKVTVYVLSHPAQIFWRDLLLMCSHIWMQMMYMIAEF
jgi:hypothetical protein